MRTLCEAVADAVSASDVGLETTLDDYMILVGTEFRKMVISMGKDITEYAVNEAFKKNQHTTKQLEVDVTLSDIENIRKVGEIALHKVWEHDPPVEI